MPTWLSPTKCTKIGLSITLTSKLARPDGTNGQAKDKRSFSNDLSKRNEKFCFNSLHTTGESNNKEADDAAIFAHKIESIPLCSTAIKKMLIALKLDYTKKNKLICNDTLFF